MSEIETQFRGAVRRYPRWWRSLDEEALFGVLLDQIEAEGRTTMTTAERRDLATNGTKVRLADRVPHLLLLIAALGVIYLVTSPFLVVGVGNTLAGVQLPLWLLNIVASSASVVVAVAISVVGAMGGLLLLRRARARSAS